jgi:hypothetical protein
MNKKWLFLLAPPAVALFIFLCGEVVMHLWNWLLPTLFGWRQITFWQGLGLLILCRLLFGGFAGHGPNRGRRRWNSERWEHMTPEEREKLRQNLRRSRCGFGEPMPEPSDPR